MNHKAHVGLVDSHSKSDGCHDYVNLAFDEFVLVVGPLCVAKTRVVGHRAHAVRLKFLRDGVNFFARKAVNDSALVLALLQKFHDLAKAVCPRLNV